MIESCFRACYWRTVVFAATFVLAGVQAGVLAASLNEVTAGGTGGASAAVALDDETFAAAGGPDNVLRVYRFGKTSPIATFDASSFLGLQPDAGADIAGATRIGDRVYWITSHSRDDEGNVKPDRYRLFAALLQRQDDRVTIAPVGRPYKNLMQTLVDRHTLRTLRLDKAARLDEPKLATLAPHAEGVRIEALCVCVEMGGVYIGFRNPRPLRVTTGRPHALVVPLDNPDEVIEGKDPIFGEGMLWDFDGLGIRGMEYSSYHKAYFVLAGSHDDAGRFVLYRWSGMKAQLPTLVRRMSRTKDGFEPESLVCLADSGELLILSNKVGERREFHVRRLRPRATEYHLP